MRMENHNTSENVLAGLEETFISILSKLHEKLNARTPPDSIYHYTNDSGLHGIIESGKLRLSNIFSLNDPSELSHGVSHAENILLRETKNSPPEVRAFAENFSRFCKNGINRSANFFVCSFSKTEHDLGQWRAYADNGRGYALEFEANSLAGDFSSLDEGRSERRNQTFSIEYDDEQITRIHQDLIDATIPLISHPFEKAYDIAQTQQYLTELSILLSIYTLNTALYFKHEAYEKESEFRFLELFEANQPIPDLKWRARSNELVAYREFLWRGLRPRALKRIVIGPSADRQKATQFVETCLRAYHPENQGMVEIDYSTIPYRAVQN